ncbi:hypothetical protein H0H92_013368 [Tricholoma furcatifolium]|nr:hypothetical protein H0H92_013368 [Tricholoma furcatifolium]
MYQPSDVPSRRLSASQQGLLASGTYASTSKLPFEDSFLPQIPKASSITPQLEAIGLLPSAAAQVSDAYTKSADHLWNVCQSSLQNAYMKASLKGRVTSQELQAITEAWSHVYSQKTCEWAEKALSSAREAVTKITASMTPAVKEKKPVFNHEYTPLLEKYFQYNAYPSAPDRAMLARKSMMTPRQIEVWFQNHRNRAKKEGKALRKLGDAPLPAELSLKSLEREMPFFTIPVSERKPIKESTPFKHDSSDDEEPSKSPEPPASVSQTETFLDLPPPPQAFPTIYVQRDANTTEPGSYKFPPPVWLRKPATHSCPLPVPVDMDDFTVEFAQKLHLRAPELKCRRSSGSQSWCSSRYIPLCPAPHPALLRLAKVSSTLPTSTTSSRRTSRSPAPSYSAKPKPVAETPSRRKASGFPKRTPKSRGTAHCRGNTSVSDSTPEPSSHRSPATSNSRTPSFESEVSSRRLSSSSSGSSSISPTTPVQVMAGLLGDSVVSCVDDDIVAVESNAPTTSLIETTRMRSKQKQRPMHRPLH